MRGRTRQRAEGGGVATGFDAAPRTNHLSRSLRVCGNSMPRASVSTEIVRRFALGLRVGVLGALD